ncbi:hypothetical protein L3Q82_015656, partial [Scortum barcoo]
MPAPIRSLTEPRGRRGRVEREGAIFQRQQTREHISQLDPVAAGHPRCLRAVAAAEKALLASRDIVGYAHVTLLVPHAVSLILLEQKTVRMCPVRSE